MKEIRHQQIRHLTSSDIMHFGKFNKRFADAVIFGALPLYKIEIADDMQLFNFYRHQFTIPQFF